MARYKRMLVISLGLLVLLGSMFGWLIVAKPVYNSVQVEAGEVLPNVQSFLKKQGTEGVLLNDITAISRHELGSYPVEIQVKGNKYKSKVTVVDTKPPRGQSVSHILAYGRTLEPEDFVKEVHDATQVQVIFEEQPDFESEGVQEVKLLLEDEGGNQTKLTSELAIYKVLPEVTVEAGTTTLGVEDFLLDPSQSATLLTDLTSLSMHKIGVYDVIVEADGEDYKVKLNVVDTNPPQAVIKEQIIWNEQTIEARHFVEEVIDATEVAISYEVAPQFGVIGRQALTIILEDEGGNTNSYTTGLQIKEDKVPPVIRGDHIIQVYLGDRVSYRAMVQVTDDNTQEPQLIIDSSGVNLKQIGEYEVHFSALDEAGNKSEKKITIEVKQKPQVQKKVISIEDVNPLADGVLKKITTEAMTQKEKAYAIYKWTKGNIGYVNTSDKSSFAKAAYQGLKTKKGDCYNYYAVAEVLLTRAGIKNMPIVKIGKGHYWNLVDCGEGWYHFDATPRRGGGEFFMLTDEALKAYSDTHDHSHVWDETLYPKTPQE